LIAPDRDWRWLTEIGKRLSARAEQLDRFDRLVPPVRLLDFGIGLMDSAFSGQNSGPWGSYLQYRDGLIIALISLWPIRRRSLAALTSWRLVTRSTIICSRRRIPRYRDVG
jgi:hypothetical protein